jgi:hypothetical protein
MVAQKIARNFFKTLGVSPHAQRLEAITGPVKSFTLLTTMARAATLCVFLVRLILWPRTLWCVELPFDAIQTI